MKTQRPLIGWATLNQILLRPCGFTGSEKKQTREDSAPKAFGGVRSENPKNDETSSLYKSRQILADFSQIKI